MTAIDGASGVAALIRQQVMSLRQSAAGATGKQAGSAPPTPPRRVPVPERDLAQLIAQRAQAIDRDDPQRKRKAFRVFLECALIAELGDSVINSPGFYQIVEDVQIAMESDPELAVAIDAAAQLLLADPA